MAKASVVLRRIITLLETGKVDEGVVHGALNGLIMNGATYKDGSLVVDGRVQTLSPDRIVSVELAAPVKEEAPAPVKEEAPAPAPKPKKPSIFD